MLSYDIDALKAGSDHPAKLLFRLWELWGLGAKPETLLPEERVINDAWTYDTANGNGIWDIVINERYCELAAGLQAMRQLGSTQLDSYVEAIESAFRRFGIDCFDPESIERGRRQGLLQETVEAAEGPFLQNLWDGAILQGAQDYIDQHIESFRSRNQTT